MGYTANLFKLYYAFTVKFFLFFFHLFHMFSEVLISNSVWVKNLCYLTYFTDSLSTCIKSNLLPLCCLLLNYISSWQLSPLSYPQSIMMQCCFLCECVSIKQNLPFCIMTGHVKDRTLYQRSQFEGNLSNDQLCLIRIKSQSICLVRLWPSFFISKVVRWGSIVSYFTRINGVVALLVWFCF